MQPERDAATCGLPAGDKDERQAALERYGILDTAAAPEFDAITQLAAQICEAPVALVSLVDRDRQWFKAETGFGRRETPRDMSICVHAIRQSGPLVVPDLSKDARFAHNPLVADEPRLRFYAGSVLRTSDGHALGTLCVLDHRPRELSAAQLRALEALSRQTMALIELHRANDVQAAMLQQLERAAEETALLLQELEHRVKNNLQLVSSLLSLQARREDSAEARRALSAFGNRLKELATVTGQLQGNHSGSLNLEFYLKKLMRALIAMHAPDPGGVAVDLRLAPLVVPAESATPIGLILNEFVTNSFKYAFRDGVGALRVALEDSGDGQATLTICDDGPGLPAGIEKPGLGMQIIPALARQIGGTASFDSENGCRLRVEFRL